MEKLTRDNLYSLEKYAEVRPEFRARVIQHKKARKVHIGPNATLYFEDQLTMQYQVQEMLRIERIFEADAINEELEAYNPLIPDGSNWKATFMIEFADVEERSEALKKMLGIEDRVWMQVEGHDKIWAIADEDLDRSNQEKTSAVHFMRFELDDAMVVDVKAGKSISAGIEHAEYCHQVEPLSDATRESLSEDLETSLN